MQQEKTLSREEQERRRVARVSQEIVENQRELAEILYVWDMRMVANDSCVIFPGDYVAVGSTCLCSSRGAMVDLSADDIAEMIGIGGLHQAFDMDDLNAPDFADRINDVMGKIAAQREYKDASRYYVSPGLKYAIAEYDPDPAHEDPDDAAPFAVERRGDRFNLRAGGGGEDIPVRQCAYREFNPGGASIMEALREQAKPEAQSSGRAYDEMMERYRRMGGNDVQKPADAVKRIPGFDQMSPREQLAVQYQLTDEYHKAVERSRAQEQAADAADQWGPKLPEEKF